MFRRRPRRPFRAGDGAAGAGARGEGTGLVERLRTGQQGTGQQGTGQQGIGELPDEDTDRSSDVLPSLGLIQQLLDELGLRHSIDSDGDLIVRWEKCSIYFFFYGERSEVLQARLYLNRRFNVDERASLTVLLDEWNRTRLFAKAYTILPDDGMVSVCAEQCHDFEGSTRRQVKYAIAMWIDILLRFGDWVDEQI